MSDELVGNAYPANVVFIGGEPQAIEIEGRDSRDGDDTFATYHFQVANGTARLTRIVPDEGDSYHVPKNRAARALVREEVEAIPVIDEVVMFDD